MWYLLVIAVLVVFFVSIYNGLVKLRTQADGAWADIDVQLKRRYDLIPNLVETVKGYAKHERETLDAVIQARASAMSAQGPAARAQAEGQLAGALKSLFALAEAYPDLKAATNFQELQEALQDVERDLARSRQYYNAVVRDYNTRTEQVPYNIVANAFRFVRKEFFETEEGSREAPRVQFD